jgi:hypothetical protein
VNRRLHLLALFVAPLGVVFDASAATFCVSTAMEFQTDYAIAKTNGEANVIRLRTGTYATPAGGLGSTTIYDYDSPGSLVIEGGWSADGQTPCAVQSSDPASTVIDGMQLNKGLRISIGDDDNLDVTVRNLTFQGGRSLIAITDDRGAGLEIAGSASYVGDILVERCIFRDNAAYLLAGGLNVSTDGTANVRNNLFTGNTAPYAAAVYVLDNNGLLVTVENNTIAENVATNVNAQAAAMANEGMASRAITNNILWHNTTASQTDVIGTQGIYFRNLIQRITGTPQPGSSKNIGVDPRFIGAADFRLAPSSPAMDAGDSSPYGGVSTLDLAGAARVSGPAIDLGAYEAFSDRVFRDGFD